MGRSGRRAPWRVAMPRGRAVWTPPRGRGGCGGAPGAVFTSDATGNRRRPTESRRTEASLGPGAPRPEFSLLNDTGYIHSSRVGPLPHKGHAEPLAERRGASRGRQQVRQKEPSSARTTTRTPPPSRRTGEPYFPRTALHRPGDGEQAMQNACSSQLNRSGSDSFGRCSSRTTRLAVRRRRCPHKRRASAPRPPRGRA